MGKKKKSGKKGGKGKVSAKVEHVVLKPPKLDETGKEFYLIQIRDLEKRVARFQRRCDELEIINDTFTTKFDQMSTDKKEICEYLMKTLQDKGDEITELNYELSQLQEARDSEKETYEFQLAQLKAEFTETKDQLTSENMILSGKLASLEEFKVQKDELMAKFDEMKEQLDKQALENKEQLYQLERQAVVDKDRLKREMYQRVNDVASEFRKVSNKQMAETTKRTIRENAELNQKLQKLSERTLAIIAEFDSLKKREKDVERENELMESIDKELNKKSQANIKAIRSLTEECRDRETVLVDFEAKEEDAATIEVEHQLLERQLESQKEELESLKIDRDRFKDEVATYEKSLAKQKRLRRKITGLLNRTQTAMVEGEALLNPDEEMTESEAVDTRRRMLNTLLVMLNSAADLGVGPAPGQLGRGGHPEQYEYAPQERTSSAKEMTHPDLLTERLAEFGLAPRPKSREHVSGELSRALSPTAMRGLQHRSLKRVPARSAGVQAGTMFYASNLLSTLPNASRIITHVPRPHAQRHAPVYAPRKGAGIAAADGKLRDLALGHRPGAVPPTIF